MKNRTIWFDMDGTIADLYNVKDWLKMLRNYDVTPYEVAMPMLDMDKFSIILNRIQARGCKLGIVSWLSREPQAEYDQAVIKAKKSWLKKYLPLVSWDEINIVAHSTPKSLFIKSKEDILFDDEEKNRNEWRANYAYTPDDIFAVLTKIALDC